MSATFLKSAAPAHSLRFWADASHIFVEIPAKDPTKLPPYVMKFSRHEGGLSAALTFVTKRHSDFSGPQVYSAPALPSKPLMGSTMQQAHAQAVLRRIGVLK